MEAKEMFKKLEYDKKSVPRHGAVTEYYKNVNEVISFQEDMSVFKEGEFGGSIYGITMYELQAIVQQCRELGWIK